MKTVYVSFISLTIISLCCLVVLLSGCGSFWNGAGAGVVGAGAGYEINAKRQLDQLEHDYNAGKMTKQEYEARKDQIKKGSLIY